MVALVPSSLLARFDRAFSFCLRLGCRPLFAGSRIPYLSRPASDLLFHFSKPVDFDRFRIQALCFNHLFAPSFLSVFSLVDVLVVLVLFLMMLVDHFSALPSPAGCSFTLDWSIICLYVFTMFDLMINYFCDLQSLIQQPFSPSLWISPLSFSPITIDSPFFYGII